MTRGHNPPARLSQSQHGISRDSVDAGALDVVMQLQGAGFTALLVGGCVRDLLLGHKPKDFDVATNATPEEVRGLFRRSRLVGRRFRIAHVRYGRELVEVSTFRSAAATEAEGRRHSAEGMILRDNVYGTLEEDAFRRDFTINALYFNPQNGEVIDYVGGLQDLDNTLLHFIGETDVRLREDPVRALRAIRFQAKIGFTLDPAISQLFPDAAQGLAAVPPARLFDETLKLFLSGYATEAWSLLADSPLRAALFPASSPDDPLVARAMKNTDERIAAGKPVTPGFMFAVLLWEDYQARRRELSETLKPAEAHYEAASGSLSQQHERMSIPRRFSQFVRDVWAMQDRLEERRPRLVPRLVQHPRFRAGYDFLVLRGASGEPVTEQADWWTRYQEVEAETRNSMVEELPSERKGRRRRKRRRRNNQPTDQSIECS